MKVIELEVHSGKYNIYIGNDYFQEIKKYIKRYNKVLIISDDKVGPIYINDFIKKLSENSDELDKNIHYYEIPNGENSKAYKNVEKIYDYLIENEFYRNSLILTLGGGVVCDLGGYIAATYMRGIDFIQVPTTLLAQVDASIGGKVAINHKKSKNIIGSFYQPKAVFISSKFLKTLELDHFKSGMVEIIKHSLISKNNDYFQYLLENSKKIEDLENECIEKTIELSCKIKKNIVEKDEKETGDRMFLNLGHTYAHALESIYNLEGISHGEAVAKGIIFELELSKYLENDSIQIIKIENNLEKIKEIFEAFKIDWKQIYLENKILISHLKKDKKNSNSEITFIKFKNFGDLEVMKITDSKVEEFNTELREKESRFIKAVIDVGSNSTRLFISEVEKTINENGEYNLRIVKPMHKWVEITSLGKGVNQSKMLNKEAIERTFKCIEDYKEKAFQYGAAQIEAYATSAVRDSENKNEFLEKISNLGINIQCIPGEIEAKLSFIGISSVYPNKEIGIIDIGGGSTEISIGMNERIDYSGSYNVGAVRVTEMFFQKIDEVGNIIENYTQEKVEEARKWIKEQFLPLSKYKDKKFTLLGVAGTVSKQVTILEKMDVYDSSKVDGYALSLKNIKDNYDMLIGKSLEERKHLPGLEPKRAEYVIAGTLILLTLLEDVFEKNKIIFSEVDNLEGSTIYFE